MWEFVFLYNGIQYFASLIEGLCNNGFFTCEFALCEDHNSSCFETKLIETYILPIEWPQILNIILNLLTLFHNNINNQNFMKFSKSERQLHHKTYNPPCNIYQPEHILNSNKILTGSLAPPSIIQRNTFGLQTRFEKERDFLPGPGTYLEKQRVKINQRNQNLDIKNKIIKGCQFNNSGSPSIPYSYYGQYPDQDEKNYTMNLLLSENVSQATKTIRKKDPAFSFSKSQRTHSYIPKTKQIETKKIVELNDNPIDQPQQSEINIEKTKLIWHQKIKRANERRLQVIQSIDPEFVPSLQLIELIKRKKAKQSPGPGQYIPSQNMHPQFQFFQNPKGTTFTSVKRFSVDKVSILGPGLYQPKNLQTPQKYTFAKSPRKVFQNKDETNFRYYINPEPQNQKQQEINKKCKTNYAFGSNSTRFTEKVQSQADNVTFNQQLKRKSNQKLNKMIKTRLKIHQKMTQAGEKDEGLLGISTMASTIQ